MQDKNIAVQVILTIITCGIYGIVWFIQITDDMNRASGDTSTSGAMYFLLTLVTCGIFGIIWAYRMGKQTERAQYNYGIRHEDKSLVYLLLSIFGLQIVVYCLMQMDLNEMARSNGPRA